MKWLRDLWEDEEGAMATEYVVLTGLIAIALIAVIVTFRNKLYSLITSFTNKIENVDKDAGSASGTTTE